MMKAGRTCWFFRKIEEGGNPDGRIGETRNRPISVWIDRTVSQWAGGSDIVPEGGVNAHALGSALWRETDRSEDDSRLVHAVQKRGL